jgi:hypothetical protein
VEFPSHAEWHTTNNGFIAYFGPEELSWRCYKEAKEKLLPKFVTDVYDAFLQVIQDCEGIWQGTPETTRILLALMMAGLGVYLGSRAERSGMSAALFFAAFGFFAYVVAVGISLIH